jgi:adenylate kinase family enzyme
MSRSNHSLNWLVIGTSGSGKSTMAKRLAAVLGKTYVEMDELSWLPDWKEKPKEAFLQDLKKAIRKHGWVVDGNYGRVRDVFSHRAHEVVWMDTGFWTCLWRVLWRSLKRWARKEELWTSKNREDLRTLFSKNGLPWWVVTTWKRRRRKTEELMLSGPYSHLRWHRVQNNLEADKLIESLRR